MRRINANVFHPGTSDAASRQSALPPPMRRKAWATLGLASASLFCAPTAHAGDKAGAEEIVAFERSLAVASTPGTIADGFADDARQYDPATEAPSIGKAAILAHLSDQMAQVKGLTGEIVNISANAEGGFGYDVSEQKGVLTMKDGKTVRFHLWATHVLRKQDGQWKILIEQITYLP